MTKLTGTKLAMIVARSAKSLLEFQVTEKSVSYMTNLIELLLNLIRKVIFRVLWLADRGLTVPTFFLFSFLFEINFNEIIGIVDFRKTCTILIPSSKIFSGIL